MNTDEYAPEMTPTSSANAKSFSVSPPNRSSASTGSAVQNDVASDRVSTSDIERLTICEKVALGMRGMFSRMRSNTMIVSYKEKPRMVRSAATVDAVTSRPTSAYTPAVMRMSCISAISTGTANFHWNRSAMYIEMTASDAMIATSAELAIDWPNVGPIEVDDDCTSPYWRRSADSTRLTWSGLSC